MPPTLLANHIASARLLRDEPSRLDGVTAEFATRLFHLITGPAGSGKNLLLRILGLLEIPDTGDVLIDGESTRGLDPARRSELRNRRFGFLFAAPFLLPSFTVVENVAMPLFRMSSIDAGKAQEMAEHVLELVSLPDRAQDSIEELTFAEQHRVSLARALVYRPEFLLVEDLAQPADLLLRLRDELGVTIIATAERPLAAADRLLTLDQGRLV